MFQPLNIRRYLGLMEQRGIANERVLEGTGVRLDRLHDPAYLVDLEQCQMVILTMIRLSGDPSLGLSFGRAARISDFGSVGHALLSSKSIRQATSLWLQYSRSLIDMLIRFKLKERAGVGWSLRMKVVTPGSNSVYRFCVEELLAFGYRLTNLLTNESVTVAHLHLAYASLGQEAVYRELFGCEPCFEQPQTEIAVRFPGLDQPLRFDPDELSEVCVRNCSQVMLQIANASPLVSRLRSILLRSTGELPGIALAAHQLEVSERTLRRRLLAAGVTYQAVLDDFRRDMATEYFRSGRMKPKEVAYLLGYKSASTFRRAFKSWTGRTVGDFLASPARASSDSKEAA